jgi:hypothetical protein
MYGIIIEPIMEIPAAKARPGLCLNPGPHGAIPARVRWLGPGKFGPPFVVSRMVNGPTELVAVCGTFMEVVAVRFRHRFWVSLAQHLQRLEVAVRERLIWNRLMDDYFVN